MKIVYEENFKVSLKRILFYIAKDKKSAAQDFKSNLFYTFQNLLDNPKMYRKSFYSDSEDYRDMIFVGYTITYKIDGESIKILDIFKWSDR